MPPKTPFADRSSNNSTVDPTATDDSSAGWDIGSRWINTSNGKVWFAVDVSVGAAIWKDVSASASASHPVTTAADDPDVNDDANAGFDVGDHWINTTGRRIWQAQDVSIGAAVWERIDSPKWNVTAVDPTTGDDNTQGYEVGSLWINTVSSLPRVFMAVGVSTGAADWDRLSNRRDNSTTVDPTANDDSGDGYEIGSVWFNTTDQTYWVAFSVAPGAAVWERVDSPKRNITTTDPAVGNDNTEGYEIGSLWINTASSPPKVYTAVDVSTGAAVWERTSNLRGNATGSNPTVGDDTNDGYEVGALWFNTLDQTFWVAFDVTAGAAVWERVDNPKRNITTSNPTVSNDNTEGYEIGSLWINTATGRVFRAISVSTGAAVWSTTIPRGGMETRNNLSAVVDPAVTDDSNSEYSIGSVWVNTAVSPRRVFVNTDASVGAALWIQTSNNPDNVDTPGLFFLGSILDYSIEGGQTAGEIQYARAFLLAGLTISAIQVFIGSGGTASRSLRVGLYNQTDPDDIAGIPVTRVAQSLSTTTGTANGSYFKVPFTSPYLVTVSGFYWIAVIASSASLKFVVTPTVYRENYPPVRREVSAGTTLPATAGVLTNPSSAITFAAAVE